MLPFAGDRESRADRIQWAIQRSGKAKKLIAKECGVTPASVSQWLSGETKALRPDSLFALAKATGVDPEWLGTGFGTPEPDDPQTASVIAWETPEDLPGDQYVIVPRVDVNFSAGDGEMVVEEVFQDQGSAYRMEWIRKKGLHPQNLYVFRVKGDSMEPKLPNGAIVTLDLGNKSVADGKIYGIRYGDELRIKRLFKRFDGGLIIHSDNNSKYPEEHIPAEQVNQIAIIGAYVAHSYDGDL